VKDFLQRVKCKRFPSIEKDMKMVLAQCGSLYLDPAATSEVYHYMVLLEKIHQDVAEFSPGLQVEAITEPALELH
jgi:protein arginine N-methyltransferase 7